MPCSKCGASDIHLVKKEDLLYGVSYVSCIKCSNVTFGPSVVDTFSSLKKVCFICGQQFESKFYNRQHCYRPRCVNLYKRLKKEEKPGV